MDVSCGHGKSDSEDPAFRGERDGFLWDCRREMPVRRKKDEAKSLNGSIRTSSRMAALREVSMDVRSPCHSLR